MRGSILKQRGSAAAHVVLQPQRFRHLVKANAATVRQGAFRRGSASKCSAADDASPTVPGFQDSALDKFTVSIMGDLHLAPDQMHLFHAAREQMMGIMKDNPAGARVVQLGDLGHRKHTSGNRSCFEFAKTFIDGFSGAKTALILGNHDLEGEEFADDADNLAAWRDVFQQPHYWAAELGPAVLLGMSTTRFRSNLNSHHEVYINDEQVAWLEEQLIKYQNRPVVVFSHAPPIGCGLKVIQNVHVKNRCAWLNHSDRPERFVALVNKYKNVKLWFSGHFHLSQNYPDSISTVGGCAFVQTGVIGDCNRDGNRHSRVLMGDAEGYQLYTLDHEGDGSLRLDMTHPWSDPSPPRPCVPEEELVCDPSAGWLCSKIDCAVGEDIAFIKWFAVGCKTMIALQDEQLVEYDMMACSPIGHVGMVLNGCEVRLVTSSGDAPSTADGSDVAAIEIFDTKNGDTQVIPRNPEGCFYQVYQPNSWRLKKEREALEAATSLPVPAA